MWHSGVKLASLDRMKLCELLLANHTINCWTKHKRISASAVSKVDWKVVKKTMKKLRPGRRRWVTKHASDNCGVGVTLVKWGHQVDPMCSVCKTQEENAEHALLCESVDVRNQWNHNMTIIEAWLIENTTDPAIQKQLLFGLNTWSITGGMPAANGRGPQWSAFNSQNEVGWCNLMMGLGSKEWGEMQQQHLILMNRQTTGKRWSIALLEKLILVSWDMWDHRNGIAHTTGNHRTELASVALREAVLQELVVGCEDLPFGATHLFECSVEDMCNRSTSQQQMWLLTVESCRRFAMGSDVTELLPDISCEPERAMLR